MSKLPKPIKLRGRYIYTSTYVQCGDYKVNNEKALGLHVKYSHNRNLKKLDKKSDISFYCRTCDLKFLTEEEMINHSNITHR